jgi:hypothetical protein
MAQNEFAYKNDRFGCPDYEYAKKGYMYSLLTCWKAI